MKLRAQPELDLKLQLLHHCAKSKGACRGNYRRGGGRLFNQVLLFDHFRGRWYVQLRHTAFRDHLTFEPQKLCLSLSAFFTRFFFRPFITLRSLRTSSSASRGSQSWPCTNRRLTPALRSWSGAFWLSLKCSGNLVGAMNPKPVCLAASHSHQLQAIYAPRDLHATKLHRRCRRSHGLTWNLTLCCQERIYDMKKCSRSNVLMNLKFFSIKTVVPWHL